MSSNTMTVKWLNERATTVGPILKHIGCVHLSLVKGEGYWYFIYDDVARGIYETESVYTMRLNDMINHMWLEDGLRFVKKVEEAAMADFSIPAIQHSIMSKKRED
jgi:hypothetical protein